VLVKWLHATEGRFLGGGLMLRMEGTTMGDVADSHLEQMWADEWYDFEPIISSLDVHLESPLDVDSLSHAEIQSWVSSTSDHS
jgi:hypothetical protein